MSKKENIQYSDDFTGEITDDVRRISYGWLGTYYEVDLNTLNFNTYNELMQALIAVSTRIKPQQRHFDTERQKKEDLAPVRQWLRDNGYPVSGKGQIRKSHLEAYREANS